MSMITISAALLAAVLVAFVYWKPTSLQRLTDRKVDLFAAKQRPNQRLAVQALIQELRAGQLPINAMAQIPYPLSPTVKRLLDVCMDSGAQAIPALELMKQSMASQEHLSRQIAAEVSAPKATALLLAFLPAFAWWVGSTLGASPLSWLLKTPWGLIVLIVGLSMEVIGVWWIHRMARTVQAMARLP